MLCGSGDLSTAGGHEGFYVCNDSCGRALSCGNHKCPLPCHAGTCPPCSTGTHLKSCPCGKAAISSLQEIERRSCLDPLPLCNSPCQKVLGCGAHRCTENCHVGSCPRCQEDVKEPCRCGMTKQKVACADLRGSETGPKEVLCQISCQQKRQCGHHRCNTTCCAMYQIGKAGHPCPLTCGRLLSCKKHECKKECHRGKCPPCLDASFDELACHCGRTILFPPIPCGGLPPVCPLPCTREHACDHPMDHTCHNDAECPKCYVLVYRKCGCGRKEVMTQCHVDAPCCGELCKRQLPCGIHKCPRSCHGGTCVDSSIPLGNSCGTRCNAGKLMCEHKCDADCHPGENCPHLVCQEPVNLRCPCGHFVMKGKCERGGPQNLHANDDYVRLECNDVCVLRMRQQQLASAFGKIKTEVSSSDGSSPTYPVLLTNAATTCPSFVKQIEADFALLLGTKAVIHRFPPMNSYYRSIIHGMAEFYRLDSNSEGY